MYAAHIGVASGTHVVDGGESILDLGRHQVSVDMRVEERAAQPQALVPSLREVPRQGADGAQVRGTQAETLRRHVRGDGGAPERRRAGDTLRRLFIACGQTDGGAHR